MKVDRFRPDHRVTVRRYHEATNTFAAEVDISADVVSISTSKTYGQVAGGFSLVTTAKLADFWETVTPNDLVTIDLDAGDGTGLRPVLVGQINRLAEALSLDSSGTPRRSFQISGFDLGKILLQHNASWDIARFDQFFGDEFIKRIDQGLQVSGTPSQLIRSVVQTYLHLQVPWTKTWVALDRVEAADDWQTLDYTVAWHEGSVWQVLERLSNRPWNVLHTETGEDGKLHVVLERAPFHDETGRLTRETLHDIPDSHAAAYNLGRDDTERTNWVYFDPQLSVFGAREASIGMLRVVDRGLLSYDEASVHRHGLRGQHVATIFTPFGTRAYEPSEPDEIQKAAARGAAVWNWYRRNHLYRNGQLTVKGSPAYRAGDGIVFGGDQYLVERVAHTYVWGQSYQTTLGVTRGQRHG
jgi:hypothetical protein